MRRDGWHNLQGYGNLRNWEGQKWLGRGNQRWSEVEKRLRWDGFLGERLEQVFCHDLALALLITVEVYLDVAI